MIWFVLPLYGSWFWILSIAFFIWFSLLVFNEEPLGAFGVLLIWVAVFLLLGDLGKLFVWALENPIRILVITFMQFFLGFMWSIAHWAITQYKDRSKYNTEKIKFLRLKGVITDEMNSVDLENTEIPNNLLAEWHKRWGREFSEDGWYRPRYGEDKYRKRFTDHKKRIANRVLYWEVSFLLYLFGDFLSMCARAIVERMRRVYQNIEDSVWKGTESDFRKPRLED